jgi:hypothetical protein
MDPDRARKLSAERERIERALASRRVGSAKQTVALYESLV